MHRTVEVARRGQITIPKSLRDDLNIEEGQRYEVRALEGGVLVLTPQRTQATEALAQIRTALVDRGASLAEMLAELRRLRETTANE